VIAKELFFFQIRYVIIVFEGDCLDSSRTKLFRVYLFQGNFLVIPESIDDEEAINGVDRDMADQAFGLLPYYAVPSLALDEQPMWGFLLSDDRPLPPGWRALPVRQALLIPGAERILRLFHILQWRDCSVYCGSCGGRNGDSPEELARLCPSCGRIEYPRIAPAVIVLITNDSGDALLAHNSKFKDRMYSLIAGFAEPGESLEDAARREIKEEINIEVDELCYIKSQSWPFPDSLMIGFSARYAGGELKPDGVEILDARWFTRETIREIELPGPGSVSRYIINRWLEGDHVN
jgi:NAD+ diphosphatase